MMRKGGSNWVDGENFFDRHDDLDALEERVRDGTHTFLTAQRRMGKTSLVRELQRRLAETGEFETVFVDLEAAADPADAIAEIGVRNKSVRGAWDRIKATFANVLKDAGGRVEE
ncbi:MAG: ATP-binding protein, partial [Rhodospirillaceae bacterium]|nr:ATP-binding protein [Rhodospirillaceae bacterium]